MPLKCSCTFKFIPILIASSTIRKSFVWNTILWYKTTSFDLWYVYPGGKQFSARSSNEVMRSVLLNSTSWFPWNTLNLEALQGTDGVCKVDGIFKALSEWIDGTGLSFQFNFVRLLPCNTNFSLKCLEVQITEFLVTDQFDRLANCCHFWSKSGSSKGKRNVDTGFSLFSDT